MTTLKLNSPQILNWQKKNKFLTVIDYQNEETTTSKIHTIIYKNILKTVDINDNFFVYEIE